jgi:hypothetical protein
MIDRTVLVSVAKAGREQIGQLDDQPRYRGF